MSTIHNKQKPTARIGFHYYPDTLHFRDSDLAKWLPELKSLGAGWLVITTPLQIAVPEAFIVSLIDTGIQPILHFKTPVSPFLQVNQLDLLLSAYSKWGVRYVAFFDRPNCRIAWPSQTWVQSDLVERFLDIFTPAAELALKHGMLPVFPPLEPGGDYWDTAFLREALNSLNRRGCQTLLKFLTLGTYAYASDPNKPIEWGKGGPERWPGARPYYTPQGQEDQRGFHIFDWYSAISQAVTGKALPLILFGIGYQEGTNSQPSLNEEEYTQRMLSILWMTCKSNKNDGLSPLSSTAGIEPLPDQVLACNYWLLACAGDHPSQSAAWLPENGEPRAIYQATKNWVSEKMIEATASRIDLPPERTQQSIAHYLLLPLSEWGVSEWHLDAIRPFVLKYQPTIGFSPHEAFNAQRVTLIGGYQSFPKELEIQLRDAGCEVERITGDGTSIASQLATR